jgi:Zinc finger, C2H2 type
MACALLRESTSFGSEDMQRNEEEPMEAFKCGHCGRKFNSQEELQQHEKECVPARVK